MKGISVSTNFGYVGKELTRASFHGVSQGGIATLQGGKFQHGFFAGAFGSVAGSGMEVQSLLGKQLKPFQELVIASAIGGTASSLGGGKFANGAISAAFVQMYNRNAHEGSAGGGRPDADGALTFGEADGWYKWGKGQPLYADLDKLDFSTVSMSRFDNPEFFKDGHPGVYVRFDSKDYVNSNQALVYGTIGIVKIGDNTIMGMPDTYNFDLKLQSGTFIRDAATLMGQHYAGFGNSFPIYFRGTTTIP